MIPKQSGSLQQWSRDATNIASAIIPHEVARSMSRRIEKSRRSEGTRLQYGNICPTRIVANTAAITPTLHIVVHRLNCIERLGQPGTATPHSDNVTDHRVRRFDFPLQPPYAVLRVHPMVIRRCLARAASWTDSMDQHSRNSFQKV